MSAFLTWRADLVDILLSWLGMGYSVVGVDVIPDYIDYGKARASEEELDVGFICSNVLAITFRDEFDVILSVADGAIGYFEREEDNLKMFGIIAVALMMGGKHIMGVCSASHAIKHFPMLVASLYPTFNGMPEHRE